MNHRLRPSLALIVLFAAGSAAMAKGDLLRLKPEVGATYRYAMEQNQAMQLELGPMGTQTVDLQTRIEYAQKAVAVADDGAVTFEITYERVKIGLNGLGQQLEFDSKQPLPEGEDNPLSLAAYKLAGSTFGSVVSAQGELREITGMDEIWDELMADLPDDPRTQQTADMARQSFGSDAVKSMLQQGMPFFPKSRVAAGKNWKREDAMTHPILGPLAVDWSFAYQGAETKSERDCHKLRITAAMNATGESPLIGQFSKLFSMGGAETEIDWSMDETEAEGTVWVDKADGVVSSLATRQQIEMSMSVTSTQGENEMKMDIGISIDQQISLDRLD